MNKPGLYPRPSARSVFNQLDNIFEHEEDEKILTLIHAYFLYRSEGLHKGRDLKQDLVSTDDYIVLRLP